MPTVVPTPRAAESFCNRRFHVAASNWIGVHIIASRRGRISDQQVNPPLEALPPLEPLPQTAEHATLSTDQTNQRGALAEPPNTEW